MFYVAVIVGQFLLNVFGVRALPHLDRFGAFWSIAGIVTIIVTLLACSSGRYQSAKDVFGTLTNLTGVSIHQ
jgi:choline transport protein